MLLVIKRIIFSILSLFSNFLLGLIKPNLFRKNLVCYLSTIRLSQGNEGQVINTTIVKSVVDIKGSNNKIVLNDSIINNTSIVVVGNNNRVEILKGTKVNNVNIIIRGTNCLLRIGKNTTFGGARLINVGKDNDLVIGEGCLFSDQIEVWASDTHAIFSSNGEWINPEKSVYIGNKVWVGSQVTILKGVNIGDGAIIGMRALVTKNVESKTLVVGSPAYVLKRDVDWSLNYPSEK